MSTGVSSEFLMLLAKAAPEDIAEVERLLRAKEAARESSCESADTIHRVGRFAYRNDFADVWLGAEHFDLSGRSKARACLRYLIEQRAFDVTSARHFETEIDPYVRAQCQLPPLPGYGELKIHHYFHQSTSDVARLGRELVRPAGRNGRYFLCVR